jgi:hypothetical protein
MKKHYLHRFFARSPDKLVLISETSAVAHVTEWAANWFDETLDGECLPPLKLILS